MKFKIGDKVRVMKGHSNCPTDKFYLPERSEHVITGFSTTGSFKFGGELSYSACRFELVDPFACADAIALLTEAGYTVTKPTPKLTFADLKPGERFRFDDRDDRCIALHVPFYNRLGWSPVNPCHKSYGTVFFPEPGLEVERAK